MDEWVEGGPEGGSGALAEGGWVDSWVAGRGGRAAGWVVGWVASPMIGADLDWRGLSDLRPVVKRPSIRRVLLGPG